MLSCFEDSHIIKKTVQAGPSNDHFRVNTTADPSYQKTCTVTQSSQENNDLSQSERHQAAGHHIIHASVMSGILPSPRGAQAEHEVLLAPEGATTTENFAYS